MGIRRRDPVSRDRYRAVARTAGLPRPERQRSLDAILVGAIVIAALVALPRIASGVGAGVDQLVTSIQNAIPLLQGRGAIELPPGGTSSVGAAPVLDAIPQYTREPQLQLSGRVPAFAVESGRTLQIALNGAVVSSSPLEQSGAFSSPLALKEGANSIEITLLAEKEVVASSAHTVVLDRTPPTLTLSSPRAGTSVDTRNVVVAGGTEPGATISINGRTVVTAADGTFTDSFTANPGTLQITVISRDRAGNETTQRVTVSAQAFSQTGTATVTVTLDKSTVKPGGTVVATIRVSDARGPRANVPVTLSVGIVTIGSTTTNAAGSATIAFAAPPNEGEASVVVLGAGGSGRAPLTIAR